MRFRLRKTGLLYALLGCAAAAMAAEPSRFVRPVGGERLRPGESIEVSWALDPHQASTFNEVELVLSLDGGRTFPLRLTRDLSAVSGRLSWRVPALPAGKARLALRGGSDDEPDSETIAAVSGVFEIAPRPGVDLEQLFQAPGEWRTRESASSPAPVADGLCGDPADQMRSAPSLEIAAECPAPAAPTGVSDQVLHQSRPGSPPSDLQTTVLRSSPLQIPLRQ